MDQPLGRAIGNANEMRQTIQILKGDKKLAPDFYELLMQEAVNMILISGKYKDAKKARAVLEEKIDNGEAAAKLRKMIKWQGASPLAVDNPLSYFKDAKLKFELKADARGYVQHIDAKEAGMAAVLLGAGRNTMEDSIDYGAGIWLNKKSGEPIKKGDVIATLYASDKKRLEAGVALFKKAVQTGTKKPADYKIVKEIIK